MPRSRLDHIVVTAPSLDAGAEYVRSVLGVDLEPGGEHAHMGTHNRLLRLGERVYLEVIAVNPAAPPPGRPRWFRLDEPDAMRAPRLATWVARADDISTAVVASPLPLGRVEKMSRGTLEWLITVREDGGLLMGGVAPTVIEWPDGVHPADGMNDSGCSLIAIDACCPEPDKLRELLRAIGFEGPLALSQSRSGDEPRLVAHIETPTGVRRMGAP
jgi:glyoxalase-like protein